MAAVKAEPKYRYAQSPARIWVVGYQGLNGLHVRRVAFSRAEARVIKVKGQIVRRAYILVEESA